MTRLLAWLLVLFLLLCAAVFAVYHLLSPHRNHRLKSPDQDYRDFEVLDLNRDHRDLRIALVVATSEVSPVSKRRRDQILQETKLHGLELVEYAYFTKEERDSKGATEALRDHTLKGFALAAASDADIVILAEDDVAFCPNFREELLTTMRELPRNWRAVHLCPGCYWGRSKGEAGHTFRFNPEADIDPRDEKERISERLFRNPRYGNHCIGNAWGGPVSVALTPKRAANLKKRLSKTTNWSSKIASWFLIDNHMMRLGDELDFVAREPQLCYEKQQGGSVREPSLLQE